MDQNQRRRSEKRDRKREGNRRRRRVLKRQLETNPEDAAFASYELGRFESTASRNEPRKKKTPRWTRPHARDHEHGDEDGGDEEE